MKEVHVKGCTIGTGIPKICVPIAAKTFDDLFAQARALSNKQFDIVEWRADWFDEVRNLDSLCRASRILRGILYDKPILFTFRSAQEGGQTEIDIAYYKKMNILAAAEHFGDIIDVELASGDDTVRSIVSEIHNVNIPVVISNHDSITPPQEEILSRLRHAEKLGGDILKISVTPQNMRDVLELLGATEQMSRESECPLITVSTGNMGIISRLSGELFGSAVTFGVIGAPFISGQINIDPLRDILELLHKNRPK